MRIDRRRVDLVRHPALRRVLLALVEARAERRSLSTAELLARGWPGERVAREAGANRVYVAIATLRRKGLREAIVRGAEGYSLEVEICDERRPVGVSASE